MISVLGLSYDINSFLRGRDGHYETGKRNTKNAAAKQLWQLHGVATDTAGERVIMAARPTIDDTKKRRKTDS